MELTVNDLALIYSDQVVLEFSQQEREEAWQQIQNQGYSNAAARWNAYLNCLCLNTFLTYLEDEGIPKRITTNHWQVVNGDGY